MLEDPQVVIRSILTANWNSANVDGRVPTTQEGEYPDSSKVAIDYITNFKKVDARVGDFILLYNGAMPYTRSAMKAFQVAPTVSIDIRTSQSRGHFRKLRDEVVRILEANYIGPHPDYDTLEILREVDLSDKTRNLWRMVIDVQLMKKYREVS